MVTYYNTKDLVSFGKYLLSEDREKSLKQTNEELPKSLPYEERKRLVHHADIANWKATQKENNTILLELPIKVKDSDNYSLVIEDANCVTHFWLPDGEYDGYSRDVSQKK